MEDVVEPAAGEDDLDAVSALEARCFTNPWTREMLARQLLESEVAHLFVLRLPEVPVAAFCACWIIAGELHVNTVAVAPERRRQGLGRRLMAAVFRAACARGATRATLEVRESNDAALGLYRSMGFAVTARRPLYYTDPVEDALILWHDRLPDAASAGRGIGHPEC